MQALQSLFTLVSSENYKIFRQKKYPFYLAFVSLLIIAGTALSLIPGNFLHFTMANYPYTVLSLLVYVFAPLAIFTLSADLIAGEIASNEIKVLLMRPISRPKILLAKILALLRYVGLLFLLSFGLSTLLSIYIGGITSVSIPTSFFAYLVGLLPLLPIMAMTVLLATLTRSGTTCFNASLLAYLGCLALGNFFVHMAPALFTTYLGMGNMVIGSVIPLASLYIGISISLGYALVFFSISGLQFIRQEF